jgi:hypothetical protein
MICLLRHYIETKKKGRDCHSYLNNFDESLNKYEKNLKIENKTYKYVLLLID